MGFTFTTNEHYFLTSLDIPPVHQQKNNPESNAIFAQNDNFTRGEEVSFSTSGNVDYELRVLCNQYKLLANNSQILNGSLRVYSFDPGTSNPPLGTFNPYEIPNFLFFGDNTGQESGEFTFRSAEVTINSTTVPESSASLALGILGAWGIILKIKHIL